MFSRTSGTAGRALETLTRWKKRGRPRIGTSSYVIPLKTVAQIRQRRQAVVSADAAVAMATAEGGSTCAFHFAVFFWDKYRRRLWGVLESVWEAQKKGQ